MKTKYIICALIVLSLIGGYLFANDMIKTNVIVLKDGNTISVNETWQVGEKIFYKDADRVKFVPEDDVEDIKSKYHLVGGNGKTRKLISKAGSHRVPLHRARRHIAG